MWESKAWVVLERIVGLIAIAILCFAVWNTLLRIEEKQARHHKEVNATLEAIRKGMDNELWQKVKPYLNESVQPQNKPSH